MQLPDAFVRTMRSWLGTAEWDELSDALHQPPVRGLRLHRWRLPPGRQSTVLDGQRTQAPLAIARAPRPVPTQVQQVLGDPVPWAPDGVYIASDNTLGRSVFHETGAFYIQEPSAMAVVAALSPQPGERVLDLCAAPGGKATAIGKCLAGTGLLVANEIHPQRAIILAQNLERLGVPAVITQERPERLAQRWPEQFDAVLVDAPCSGEGMFRKDPEAIAQWSPDAPERCAERQRDILRHALRLVRPGGRLVYSTCTFNPVENEQVVAWVLREYPVELEALPLWPGWEPGRPEWAGDEERLLHTRRLWPHKARGEGHFIAALRLSSPLPCLDAQDVKMQTRQAPGASGTPGHNPYTRRNPRPPRRDPDSVRALNGLAQLLHGDVPEDWTRPIRSGSVWFAPVHGDLPLDGLRVLRPGLPLVMRAHQHWAPHHALAMALAADAAQAARELSADEAMAYLAGEALPHDGPADMGPWIWLHFAGLPLGWGKVSSGRINNHYPKGLRRAGLTAELLSP